MTERRKYMRFVKKKVQKRKEKETNKNKTTNKQKHQNKNKQKIRQTKNIGMWICSCRHIFFSFLI